MGTQAGLPACASCGVDDCWAVEGPAWTLADLRCTNCDTAATGPALAALLARHGGCDHDWRYHEEFGSLPINACERCGLAWIDPHDQYGGGP